MIQRALERIRRRVAAADPTHHALARETLGETARRRDRCGARALRDDVSFHQQQAHRAVEIVVGDEHEVIE